MKLISYTVYMYMKIQVVFNKPWLGVGVLVLPLFSLMLFYLRALHLSDVCLITPLHPVTLSMNYRALCLMHHARQGDYVEGPLKGSVLLFD